jgi:hypothetical protein
MSRHQVQAQVKEEEAQELAQELCCPCPQEEEDFEMDDCCEQQRKRMPQPQSEPQCCAICFTEPASPLNVGQSQRVMEEENEGKKENHNHNHRHASITTVNHASGFACLPCCGGAQGQREATTSTKICTSCILTLYKQSRKLEEAANSFRVNADQIMFNVNGNGPTTPTPATVNTATAAGASTSMLVSPEKSNSQSSSSTANHMQESCTIHCPRCRHRVSVSESNGNGYVYITSTARSKAQPNVHVQTCPIMPMNISTSMSMRNDGDLVHVLNPYGLSSSSSSSSSARLELPRRARAPLVPLEAPRNGRREGPSIALRRQRHNRQLFRSPLGSPTFHRMMRQESNASVSVEEHDEEPQQAIIRTLSFWQ